MEEEIKEEERSADEAGKHGNNAVVVDIDDPPWVKYMEAKLAFKSKHCQRSHPFTICKVPRDIREVDSVAHDPLVVSIGPYHRGNKNLLDMEQVKWRNLNAFRGRVGKDFNKYLKAMKEIEQRARDCYSGNIDMDADEFIEMMLLDGLLMIKLFSTRRRDYFNVVKEEPIYTISGMLRRVGLDMLLLENQLPFFVLERLWDVDQKGTKFALWSSACTFIHSCLPFNLQWDHHERVKLLRVLFDEEEKKKEKENPAEMINEDRVHHLLHLVYLLLKPTSQTSTKKSEPTESEPPAFIKKMKTLSFLPSRCHDCFRSPSSRESQSTECTAKLAVVIKKILPFLSPSKSEDEKPPPLKVIPSAVELHEAGVVFKCVKANSFLDVKFEQGTMKMPRPSVEDSTKPLLRNFIAYEQCFPNQGDHITSYCYFMDQLVNTPRDVEILKGSAIVENCMGSDEAVAILFNDLCKETFVSDLGESYLGESFKDVMKHTQKTWPKWRARLKHDYFSNPWAIISVLAATFVIILTAVQTYYAVVA